MMFSGVRRLRFSLAGAPGRVVWSVLLGLIGFALVGAAAAAAAAAPFVYVANHLGRDVSQFDAPLVSSGALRSLTPATTRKGTGRPNGVAVSPNGQSAYVVASGAIWQYNIDPATGVLTPKSPASVATGHHPNGMAVSPNGKSAYVTNLSDNTVSQYTIDPSTGKLSPKSPAKVTTGSEPVEVAITPDGKSAYVTNANGNTVSQYTIDPSTGKLSPKSPATVATGTSPYGVAVSPNGKSAYVTNLSDNTVSQYPIDPTTGALSPKSPATAFSGGAPYAVAVTPDGTSAYVPNSTNNSVSQFNINPTTGALSPKSPATVATGGFPIAVAVNPDGKSAYVTNLSDNTVSQYTIDPTTGELTPKSPATVATGDAPIAVVVAPNADASVKVRAPGSVKRGSRLTYRITVANSGPSSAWQVTLKDILPSGTKIERVKGRHCNAPKSGSKSRQVTCKLGTIKPGKDTQIRIVVKVSASPNKGSILDKATVKSVTPDPRHRNNKAHRRTNVAKRPQACRMPRPIPPGWQTASVG
jgi:uncharacterized repeat protein (TIGR01451 family)